MKKILKNRNQFNFTVLTLIYDTESKEATLYKGMNAPHVLCNKNTSKKIIYQRFEELKALGFKCEEV